MGSAEAWDDKSLNEACVWPQYPRRIGRPGRANGIVRGVKHMRPDLGTALISPDERLRKQVYWIGGGTCAGKSTVTERLCAKYDLFPYHVDDHWEDHLRRANLDDYPNLHRRGQTRPSDWFVRLPEEASDDELAVLSEEVSLATQDLRALPPRTDIVAEGVLFLPLALKQLGVPKERAIWLIPTPASQRIRYRHRGAWVDDVLSLYDDPRSAWESWMRRDAIVAQRIRQSVMSAGYHWIQVSDDESIEQLVERVEDYLFVKPMRLAAGMEGL